MAGIGPVSETPPPLDLWIGPFDPRPVTQTITAAANVAYLYAFQVNRPQTVSKARVYISNSSGNIDMGIYDAAGNRLASAGATASPGTGGRDLTLTAPITLVPGTLYYAAFAADNASIVLGGATGASTTGLGSNYAIAFWRATSYPLPSSVVVPAGGANVACIVLTFVA